MSRLLPGLVAALLLTGCAIGEGLGDDGLANGGPENPEPRNGGAANATGGASGGGASGGTGNGGDDTGVAGGTVFGSGGANGDGGAAGSTGGTSSGSGDVIVGGGAGGAPSTGGVAPGPPPPPPPDACAGTPCSDRGVCTATSQGPTCACDEGFTGPSCSVLTADYGRKRKIAENLADPDVIRFSDDRYVLTGTGSGVDFTFLESRDLVQWNEVGVYDPSAVDPSHDYCFLWAPDIVQAGGALYLYFSAHRGPNGATTCPPPGGSDVTTYRATSPDGSLRFGVPELLFQGQGGAASRTEAGCPGGGCSRAIRIDPAVYGDRLYYVFFDAGNNIGSVALSNPSDLRLHAGPAGWALGGFEEGINEAPEIFERGGLFYLFFSAAWFDSQYATFYVVGNHLTELTRDLPVRRLTTPVRRGNGTLVETHGHNSIAQRRGEAHNFFHQGVFDTAGHLIRRDTYRQRVVWNPDGTAMSQNHVVVSWNSIGGGNRYSLDLVLRDGTTVGPCIAVGRIGLATTTTYTGVCPDAADRLVHKSEVQSFRLYASPADSFVAVGETSYDGYSDAVSIVATAP